jgi:UDP-MurNAc hydroxylase
MKLFNFGGATAILEHAGVRMLMDPWLDDGIFHGSWVHYPPLRAGIEQVGRLDYIYISHIHEDHCSIGTLRHLDRNAVVLVMGRRPNFVLDFLKRHALGFREIRVIDPRSPVELQPGLVADMVEADPADAMASAIDSALVLHWDGRVVLNANDCQPHPAMLEYVLGRYGSPDVAMLPYSGGSGYPSCYLNLSDAQKQAEADRIRTMRLDAFVQTVRALNPRYAVPFADQYAIAGSRAALNRYVSHPTTPAAVRGPLRAAGLEDRLVLLNSGQAFDFDSAAYEPPGTYQDLQPSDRDAYLDGIASQHVYDQEQIEFSPSVPLERLVGYARERLWGFQQQRSMLLDWHIVLDVPGAPARHVIALNDATVRSSPRSEPLPQPFLRIEAPRTLMCMLLLGHISWNIADAALFLDYERVPNRYDTQLYYLLNLLKV